MKKFCLLGRTTKEPLSYKGRVIVHESREEFQYLFPNNRVVELPAYFGEDLTIPLKFHPDMGNVKFPLEKNMNQFRK
jgi:hypothetical protein